MYATKVNDCDGGRSSAVTMSSPSPCTCTHSIAAVASAASRCWSQEGSGRDQAQRSGRLQPVHVGERVDELRLSVWVALAERPAGGCGDLEHGADQAEQRDRMLRRERITDRPHEGEVRAVVAGSGCRGGRAAADRSRSRRPRAAGAVWTLRHRSTVPAASTAPPSMSAQEIRSTGPRRLTFEADAPQLRRASGLARALRQTGQPVTTLGTSQPSRLEVAPWPLRVARPAKCSVNLMNVSTSDYASTATRTSAAVGRSRMFVLGRFTDLLPLASESREVVSYGARERDRHSVTDLSADGGL